jgi:hypothetical protein
MAEYSHAELCLGEPLGEPKAHLEMFGKTGTTGQPGPTILIAGKFIRR